MNHIHMKISTFSLLCIFILSACSGESQAAAPTDTNVTAGPEQTFFANLLEMKAAYDFSSIQKIDLSNAEDSVSAADGSVWQAADGVVQSVEDLSLNEREGVFVEFSFSEAISTNDPSLSFILQPASAAAAPKVALTFNDIKLATADGEESSIAFPNVLEAQAGTRFALFVNRTQSGGFDVRLWATTQPDQVAFLSIAEPVLDDAALQLGFDVSGTQTLTVYRIWKLAYTPDAQARKEAALEKLSSILGDTQVSEIRPVESLTCGGRVAGENGTFSWEGATNEHCDLGLYLGQALTFDFVLRDPVDDWPKMAIVMLDANMENIEMPTKSLGVALANDRVYIKQDGEDFGSFEYSQGFELEADRTYSAVIVMDEFSEFNISIRPADDPDRIMAVVIQNGAVQSTWLPESGEEWVFGMWLSGDQQVTISNMNILSLGNTASSTTVSTADDSSQVPAAEQVPEWFATGMIPNLNDFYIPEITPYTDIECDEDLHYQNSILDLPVKAEDFTHQCQTETPKVRG